MRGSICVLLACMLTVAGVNAGVGAEVRAVCRIPAEIALPCRGASETMRVFVRGNSGWQPADYTMAGERVIFRLRPGELGSSEIRLLIDPPAWLDIDDITPPTLTGLKIDGQPLAAETTVHLGMGPDAPATIRLGARDAENRLDFDSVVATLDGVALPAGSITVEPGDDRSASVEVRLGKVEYGTHRAVVSIADASPQANRIEVAVLFSRVDMTNYLLPTLPGVKLTVSSSFPGYEDLTALNDGRKEFDGVHCQNDVSWASAEQPGPHWVEARFGQPRELKEVTVYWAFYGSTHHTSQKLRVQAPEGGGWRTVYTSPTEGHPVGPCTTFSFPVVTVDGFRIVQDDGGGAAGRPQLMWIAEVEAR